MSQELSMIIDLIAEGMTYEQAKSVAEEKLRWEV